MAETAPSKKPGEVGLRDADAVLWGAVRGELSDELLGQYCAPDASDDDMKAVWKELGFRESLWFRLCALARKSYPQKGELHRGISGLLRRRCKGGTAKDVLEYIRGGEDAYGNPIPKAFFPLELRPRKERATSCRPLVPEEETKLLPNLVDRNETLGYCVGVLNTRLLRLRLEVPGGRSDVMLAAYGTPGIGKTRGMQALATIDPEKIAKYVEAFKTNGAEDSKLELPEAALNSLEGITEICRNWVTVPTTYNSDTKYLDGVDGPATHPADPSAAVGNAAYGFAIRMLYSHFFEHMRGFNTVSPLDFVAQAFPDALLAEEVVLAILEDTKKRALLVLVDELVRADQEDSPDATVKTSHDNARAIIRTVGTLQSTFNGKDFGNATVFGCLSTLDKVIVGTAIPGSRERTACFMPLPPLGKPASAASAKIRSLVVKKDEYRMLFDDCGHWPRGALYCAKLVDKMGEASSSINELETGLMIMFNCQKWHAVGDIVVPVMTHALCSHRLVLSEPVPGTSETLSNMVAMGVYDGIVRVPVPAEKVRTETALQKENTYVPYISVLRLLMHCRYEVAASLKLRKITEAQDAVEFVQLERSKDIVDFFKDEIIIGLRGGKSGERFNDGHEFERLIILRIGLCPSLRLYLGLPSYPANETAKLLFGEGALFNAETKKWVDGSTILCSKRRVVVMPKCQFSTFLKAFHSGIPKDGQTMADLLDDVIVFPEPTVNNPGFEFVMFASVQRSDGTKERVAIAFEARCSTVTVKEKGKKDRPTLSLEKDVQKKHSRALIEVGLVAKPKPKRKRKSAAPAAGPKAKKPRLEKKPITKMMESEDEEEEKEEEEKAEEEVKADQDVPVEEEVGVKALPKWAVNPANGFDRFILVVVSNRQAGGVSNINLPDNVVVVSHLALPSFFGKTLYLRSRLDYVEIEDVLEETPTEAPTFELSK